MAKTYVEALESFTNEVLVGALEVKSLNDLVPGSVPTVLDEARVVRAEYVIGQRLEFRSKKDAQAFLKSYPGKFKLL